LRKKFGFSLFKRVLLLAKPTLKQMM